MPASLSFAKLIATPSDTAWSQVYHAGNLFALVSLTSEKTEDLNSIGKEMFNAFESNFFSLEKKTLQSISEVLTESLKDIPQHIIVSACIAFSKEAILYLFLVGDGMILMKRGDKIGVILSSKDAAGDRKPHTSSGYLNHEDVVLMQTGAFQELVPYETVEEALERHLPNDITEKLSSTKIERKGDASAVALMYQGATSPDALTPAQEMRREMTTASPLPETEEEMEASEEKKDREKEDEGKLPEEQSEKTDEASEIVSNEPDNEKTLDDAIQEDDDIIIHHREKDADEHQSAFADERIPEETSHPEPAGIGVREENEEVSPVRVTRAMPKFQMPSKRVLIGIVAFLLLCALVFSIFFTKQQTKSNESQAVYEQTITEATQKYEEAEGLKNLNASLAQDDYKEAAQLINNALPKIQKGSNEEKELRELLAKIEQNIIQADGATVETKSVDLSESPLLSYAVEKSASYVAADDHKEYALTSSAVTEGDEELIENEDDWKSVAGIGAYNGNIYILDKNEGILKFSAGSDGYGKSSYFSGDTPSLTSAVSLGIDGSIYVLFSDGSVKKYTRGKEETFSISELPSPLKSPKQLVTGVDMDSIYILDSGNSRIVKMNKDGVFQKAWKADVLGTANLIDVQESEDKAYILKGKNLFMLPLE